MLIITILGLIGNLNHSMWRDELNVWLIARDSNSLTELLQNIKYEGHPALWYFCLAMLNQISPNPVLMQIFHLLLAITSIYLFFNYSPFTKLQKILFAFGYLPFYEYLLISRNYAIGLLSIFLFCILYKSRKYTYIWLSLILAMMANANAYCLFISAAFCLTLTFEYIFFKSTTAKINNIILSLTIYISGVIAALWLMIPPADSSLQGGLSRWMLEFDGHHLAKAISRIWSSYITILIPADSQFLDVCIFAIISLVILAFVGTIFLEKPVVLFFYLVGTIEIIFFTYVKFLGSQRHYGHLYIILIAAFWLSAYYSNYSLIKLNKTWLKFVQRNKKKFLIFILICQIISGIVSFSRDLFVPYSASRATANFIKKQQFTNTFIVGSQDFTITPIAGYLNTKIYYPESKKLGSFVLFNSQRKEVSTEDILSQINQIINQENNNILLILNYKIESGQKNLDISEIAKFKDSLIYNEKYYLYNIRKSKTVNSKVSS